MEALFDVKGGRAYLTEAGRNVPPTVIVVALAALGLRIKRVSVWRAQKARDGVLIPDYRQKGHGLRRRLPHGHVRLSDDERILEPVDLAELHGISVQTADLAQWRGWYEVHKSQTNLTPLAESSISGVGQHLPEDLQARRL